VLILLAPNAENINVPTPNSYFSFQYNPERLVHTFSQNTPPVQAGNSAPEVASPPSEYFSVTFDLDSVDLDPPNQSQTATDLGVHPALAMLELMMQPQTVNNQTVLPIVVFKWGAKRVVAVRVVSMSVEEKTFDQTLNPTRATVALTLRVLNASEVGASTGARGVCVSHQNTRVALADAYKLQTGQGGPSGTAGTVGSAAALGGSSTAGTAPVNPASAAAATSVGTTKTVIKKA